MSQLMAFVAAADCGSFTGAAQIMHVTQPSLSKCIKELECTLGVNLFDRSKKGVLLSTQGNAFLPRARSLLNAYSDATVSLSRWRAGPPPAMNVVGSSSIMSIVLPTLLRNLQDAFGGASLRVSEAWTVEVIQQVLDGRAKLGVAATVEPHAELRHTPVLEVQFGILAGPACPLPERIDRLSELNTIPFVRCGDQSNVTRALRRNRIDFHAYFESPLIVENVQAAAKLLKSSGLAAVCSAIGATHAEAEGLRFLPLPGLLPTARVDIISRRDAVFDERLERLRDILRASLHQAPWIGELRKIGVSTDASPALGQRSERP